MLSVARTRPAALRSALITRSMAGPSQKRMEHTLPPLPYAYDALEPHISKEIMTLHHTKHHQTYVTGINAAEAAYSKLSTAEANDVSNLPLTEKIALQAAIKFNGGGHINHSLFWKNLSPEGGKLNEGNVKALVDRDFGGLEALKKEFNAKTAAIQGSGWGWVGYNKTTKRLDIVTTSNQDPLTSECLPVWTIPIC